ncbi:hypothetical protein [Klebsiella pneumoniae]|uniref:hypothetical protein n=1 Tax=Klebsiella pneumoniae TaxID=573 RepID=UPI001D18565A|nr:hypothetical protein [Klebsiella pneumoniae]
MTILIKTLKIMASGVVFVSGLTTASSTVYFLPEAKSMGVASSDKNALMFLGMDRDVNLKGICFAMTKQSSSIVPLVDITATTDNGRFTMHGLRPNVSDSKEVAIKWSAAPDMTPQTVLYRRPVAQFSNFQPKIVSSWLILALFQANFLISGRSRLCPYQLVNSNQVRQGE